MPGLAIQRNILTPNPDVQNMDHRTPVKKSAKAGSSSKPGRRFTEEEKAQLLENFDLEIADREARMRSNVADILARFLVRQENEVTRIPRALRSLTVGEFADKYDGSISACLQGMAQARMESAQDAELGAKRKWQASQVQETIQEAEGSRAPKTARKAPPPSSAVRNTNSRVSRTPSTNRTLPHSAAPPAPSHTRPRLNATPLRAAPLLRSNSVVPSPYRGNPRGPTNSSTQPTSRSVSQPLASAAARPPTSATFAPTLPPSAPVYPRMPRKGEQWFSANGSPLANPLDLDQDIPPEDQLVLDSEKQPRSSKPPLNLSKRTSSIRIRPDRSHSAASVAQMFGQNHNRHPSASSTSTLVSNHDFPPSNSSTLNSHSHADSTAAAKPESLQVPRTPPRPQRSASAVVLLPTSTGQVLELDPLLASPGAVDALEGISDSAKKMAKEEMVRFVTEAVARWNVRTS